MLVGNARPILLRTQTAVEQAEQTDYTATGNCQRDNQISGGKVTQVRRSGKQKRRLYPPEQ